MRRFTALGALVGALTLALPVWAATPAYAQQANVNTQILLSERTPKTGCCGPLIGTAIGPTSTGSRFRLADAGFDDFLSIDVPWTFTDRDGSRIEGVTDDTPYDCCPGHSLRITQGTGRYRNIHYGSGYLVYRADLRHPGGHLVLATLTLHSI